MITKTTINIDGATLCAEYPHDLMRLLVWYESVESSHDGRMIFAYLREGALYLVWGRSIPVHMQSNSNSDSPDGDIWYIHTSISVGQ